MEVYAAFAEHTDTQVGRLIDFLRRGGHLDDTLVFYVLGDNGASTEGGLDGTLNEHLLLNGLEADSAERMLPRLDEIGGPMTYPHYPAGWALAMDTPYAWAKQVASHYGGTRNGLIVHWPGGFRGRGELRHQWHHVIDIVPTILEAAQIPAPVEVDGVVQRPIEGTSMCYTFDDAEANDQHTTQYFEMFGNRGIYHDGWTAVTKHRTPWNVGIVDLPRFTEDIWELYDTNVDWTQARDIAIEHPDKLVELQRKFLEEARKYRVLPLDDRVAERFNPDFAGRRTLPGKRRSMLLDPTQPGLPEDTVLNVKNTSFLVTAAVELLDVPASGVLIAQGGRFGGWSLYMLEGRLSFCHNLCGLERHYVRSACTLGGGSHEIQFRFDYDGGGAGRGGNGELVVDGTPVASAYIPRTTPFFFAMSETLDVGRDRGTPVTEEYPEGRANAFTGTLHSVRIDVLDNETPLSPEDRLNAALVTH
ncbi:hypothetical protein Rruber_05307 (plasmid) [Rhodococcus ruber]